ncbi:uracil-DNA glycosylase family protein [Marinobacterium rhizophilum]|uniref:Uracil-DNA glycosylase family protein n=1 Tax=Marinobacterium rhizophilum TaxID=420402 RepID=A0ABY5HN87_9GAMM|nr:uracil-DNA glycosylase family protein [Marinobacterium rhizophilum]UTW12665.1 uracil-DNA glycosylase family protein [Marinobacterium rhizophilum]
MLKPISAHNCDALVEQVRQCRHCEGLPDIARPIVQASSAARILIIGQAPGSRTTAQGRPFDDASGERLRSWLGLERELFYDPACLAIMPMGFCFPGSTASGDRPPRRECAPLWHPRLLEAMPAIRLTLLIGQYAQQRYIADKPVSLTQTVARWRELEPGVLPLPHPSPRNRRWFSNNPWFDTELLPELRRRVTLALAD